MKFVYKPEGVEPRKWEFDPTKLISVELEVIEVETGLEYIPWLEAFQRSSVRAIHGLLYVLLKRDNPKLQYSEVQFSFSEVDIEQSDAEAAADLAALEARTDLTPDEQTRLEKLRALDLPAAGPKE